MYTKRKFNNIFILFGICLLINVVQIPFAVPSEEDTVSLEIAVQTALRENPELNAFREKVKVARAKVDGIALLDNPELETEFAGGYRL